jgi:hypothetical protein
MLKIIGVSHGGRNENRTRRLKRKDINRKTPADSHVQVLTTPKAL